jgi:hypothetical protein
MRTRFAGLHRPDVAESRVLPVLKNTISGGAYPNAPADDISCPQEERKTEETELEIQTLRKQLDVL